MAQITGTSAQTNFISGFAIKTPGSTVAGSVSGNMVASQPERGNGVYLVVLIYLNGLNGTATYNFPVTFAHNPMVVIDSNPLTTPVPASVVTSLSTSAVTITGATTTGYIMLVGS